MKYRIAYAIACSVDWIDNVVFDHGERQPFIWLDIKINGNEAYFDRKSGWIHALQSYRLCHWSGFLHEWAAEMCCDLGCARCS